MATPGRPELRAILGVSPAIVRLRDEIDLIARSSLPILVLGETGTGKELVASAIHACSGRPGALHAVNCAALRDLAEAKLCGYERGAFTGAEQRTPGFFERAGRGTALLDELAELPLETVQPLLLRLLADGGAYERLGSRGPSETLLVHARIVSATNADFGQLVRRGSFREDLAHRLAAETLRIPPLRDRREDIPLLADAFAGGAVEFTADGRAWMQEQAWTGNVRQLERFVKGLAARYPRLRLDADVLRGQAGRQWWAPLAKAVERPAASEPTAPAPALPAPGAREGRRERQRGGQALRRRAHGFRAQDEEARSGLNSGIREAPLDR